MKKKFIIGLDYDGVITHNVLGRLLDVVGINEIVLGRLFEIVCSIKWFRRIVIWMERLFVRPVDGAIECVGLLLDAGHEIIFITSRGFFGCLVAKEYIRRKFGCDLEIIGVGWKNSKLEATRKFELDVFVDDTLRKLELLFGHVPHLILFSWRRIFLFSQKRGREQQEVSAIMSVFSWEKLYQEISALSTQKVS